MRTVQARLRIREAIPLSKGRPSFMGTRISRSFFRKYQTMARTRMEDTSMTMILALIPAVSR